MFLYYYRASIEEGIVNISGYWMNDIKGKRSQIAIYSWMVLVFLDVVFRLELFPILGYPTAYTDYPPLPIFINMFMTRSIVLMGLLLRITVFFMYDVNRSYWYTQFFPISMYRTYISQPVVIAYTIWLWVSSVKSYQQLGCRSA